MSDFDRTNTGVLFTNDRKQNDKQPDYTGNINIDGKEFWLSAWNKQGSKEAFFSIAVKPKDDAATGASKAQQAKDSVPDDLPNF
jgi:hypothetical protein